MDDLMREGMRGLGPAQIAAMTPEQLRERGKPVPQRVLDPDAVTVEKLRDALSELPPELPVELMIDYMESDASLPRIERREVGPVVVIGWPDARPSTTPR